jgi:crossover junction endodeoxyribonuclease RuvC
MLVLGIDPGTATTGFGLVRETERGELEMVQYGALLTPAGELPERRLLMLYRQLKELILLHRPDSAAVEKLFFQKNVTTAIAVGQARGVILLALAEAGIRLQEYTPMEVKQAVAGYGGAEKHQMQVMVKALLGLPDIPRPDDAADALAIAICHLHSDRYAGLTMNEQSPNPQP